MNFLVDAQLPYSLKTFFSKKGYNCLHTLDLIKGNNTTNKEINEISIAEKRFLITKDSDFYDSYLIKQQPYKLILVKLGNTSTKDLVNFFNEKYNDIIEAISYSSLLVLTK